jgi:glycosyltransferase involved in cell wall biosynthesis
VKDTMRALIAAPYYPPHLGGIERYSAGVATELRRRGWRVDVVHSVTDGSALRRTGPAGEALLGLPSREVAGRLPVPLPGRRTTAQLREIRRARYDFTLIQSHLFLSNLLVARAVGPEHTVWLNLGSGHVPAGGRLADRLVAGYEHVLASRLRRRVGVVAGVSEEAAAWLEHLSVRTRASVGNAVDGVSPARDGRRPGPLRLLYVGRLEPGKGALEVIRLVHGLPASVQVELTVCGGGTLGRQVELEARASTRNVELTGAIPYEQVRARLADADVLVYPSTYPEGFPTVFLDAGAAGCPVLTYPVGGSRELLGRGGGWRVADAPAAAARLQELADRPTLATQAGEDLRRIVRSTYTWQAVVDRLLRLGGVSE